MKKQDVLDQFQSLLLENIDATTYPEQYRFLIGYSVDDYVEDMPRYREILIISTESIPDNAIRLIKIMGVRYL